MKVLHIVKTAVGASWVLHLVRVLRAEGVEVVVALPSATEGFAPRYRECGAEVVAADVDFSPRAPWRLPAAMRRCRELVARVQPDLIHTHHVGTTYVARLALGKRHPVPRVYWVAGLLHLEYWLFAKADVALAGPRDYWQGINRKICEKYAALGVPRDRVELNYIGIEVARFRPGRQGKLRAEIHCNNGSPLVGMVAWMYPPKRYVGQQQGVKGHEFFFEAMQHVLRERPDARGVLIGGAWVGAEAYEQQLRQMAKQLCGDKIIFLGSRKNVQEILPDLDVNVLPSLSEGMPQAAGEALLSGVAVVATNVGGLPDVVRDGDTGWLVPPRDPQALARAILDALAHPDEARRRAARGGDLVRQLLDAERTGRDTLAFYRRILAATQGGAS